MGIVTSHGTADAKRQLRADYWNYPGNSSATDGKRQCHWRERAIRRVLVLERIGIARGQSSVATLYAGLQLILPGSRAFESSRNQSALRFIVEVKAHLPRWTAAHANAPAAILS